jgi:iron complex outermembrane recepter protein
MSRLARPLHQLTLSLSMAFDAVRLLTVQASYAAESAAFSIPAGDLSQALNSLAEQAGLVQHFQDTDGQQQ